MNKNLKQIFFIAIILSSIMTFSNLVSAEVWCHTVVQCDHDDDATWCAPGVWENCEDGCNGVATCVDVSGPMCFDDDCIKQRCECDEGQSANNCGVTGCAGGELCCNPSDLACQECCQNSDCGSAGSSDGANYCNGNGDVVFYRSTWNPSCGGGSCNSNSGGSEILVDDCSSSEICSNGACVNACTPDCSGKSCGDDGCGGSCGSCGGSQVCSDNNCCTLQNWYLDNDGDGYGNPSATGSACAQPGGYVSNNQDCNDASASIRPGATETCNGVDDNCANGIDENIASIQTSCGVGACYKSVTQTCVGGSMSPACVAGSPTSETCNYVDDDCDGSVDEGVKTTFYRDADNDFYTNNALTAQNCSAPAGYRAQTVNDCNDANAAINPGATETCNGLDDDCDGSTDENLLLTRYRDADGDLYTNNSWVISTCDEALGYLPQTANDCNDGQATAYPGHAEVCGDGFDNECDATNYCDYDNASCSHGDNDCGVAVTGINVPVLDVCANANVDVNCNSSISLAGGQYNVNSIVATLGGSNCMYYGWSGNVAQFTCLAGGNGVQEARCSIDSAKSFQIGSDQVMNVTVFDSEVGLCFDGIDNDCNGLTDGNQGIDSDPVCCAQSGSQQASNGVETSCTDGLDNDCDGSIDCGDSDCGDADGNAPLCAACTGSANTWQFGNDTRSFGGYLISDATNIKECCGDDLNEDLSTGSNGCCNGPNECIDAIGVCRSGTENTQALCSNGVDDDCDGQSDLNDAGCYGSIQGVVYDAAGGGLVLVNANVSISPPSLSSSFSASDLSDSNGDFSIVKAIIGTYKIVSRKNGYVDSIVTITVSAGQVTMVNFSQVQGLNCKSDCTDNNGLCNSACHGFVDSSGASCNFISQSCNGRAKNAILRFNNSGMQFETTCCEGPTTSYNLISDIKPSCPNGLSQVVQSTPVLLNGIRVIQKTVICRRTQ